MTNNIKGDNIKVTQTIISKDEKSDKSPEAESRENPAFIITPEQLGTITHAAIAAHNTVFGYPLFTLNHEQIESQKAGVIRFLDNPNITPEQEHVGWIGHKVGRDGWTHGDRKDQQRRTHDMFIPYDQLSLERQVPSRLFVAICRIYHPYIIR